MGPRKVGPAAAHFRVVLAVVAVDLRQSSFGQQKLRHDWEAAAMRLPAAEPESGCTCWPNAVLSSAGCQFPAA